MNIYAKKGDKVVFTHPNAGNEHHQQLASKYLKLNETYTIDHTDVGGWHTSVYIQEVPDVRFNSVLFEDAPNSQKSLTEPTSAEYRLTRVGNLMKRSGSKTFSGQEEEMDHPNIALNTVYEGYFPLGLPEVGKGIIFVASTENGHRLSYNESGVFSTAVARIENHFYYTKNSVYKVEKLK